MTLIASCLLDTTQCNLIIRQFRPLLPELVHRITQEIIIALQQQQATDQGFVTRYLASVVALSKIVAQAPQLLTQALAFFNQTPSPLEALISPAVFAALKSHSPPDSRTTVR